MQQFLHNPAHNPTNRQIKHNLLFRGINTSDVTTRPQTFQAVQQGPNGKHLRHKNTWLLVRSEHGWIICLLLRMILVECRSQGLIFISYIPAHCSYLTWIPLSSYLVFSKNKRTAQNWTEGPLKSHKFADIQPWSLSRRAVTHRQNPLLCALYQRKWPCLPTVHLYKERLHKQKRGKKRKRKHCGEQTNIASWLFVYIWSSV